MLTMWDSTLASTREPRAHQPASIASQKLTKDREQLTPRQARTSNRFVSKTLGQDVLCCCLAITTEDGPTLSFPLFNYKLPENLREIQILLSRNPDFVEILSVRQVQTAFRQLWTEVKPVP